MNGRGRSERPAIFALTLDDLRDAVGELFVNAPVVLAFNAGALACGIRLPGCCATGESASLIGELVLVTAMSVRGVERLHQFQMGAAGRCLGHFVGFEAATIGHNDKRSWCHDANSSSRSEGRLVRLNTISRNPKTRNKHVIPSRADGE